MINLISYFLLIVITVSRCSVILDEISQQNFSKYCNKMENCEESTHVMCMYYRTFGEMGPTCVEGRKVELTNVSKEHILSSINRFRIQVAKGEETGQDGESLPKAYGMRQLKWDEKLASFAQVLANQCRVQTDLCRARDSFPNPDQYSSIVRFTYPGWQLDGENTTKIETNFTQNKLIYVIDTVLNVMYHGKDHVTKSRVENHYGSNIYLTMVYGWSTHVGCGMTTFVNFDGGQKYNDVLFVCNLSHKPHVGQKVYETDPPHKERVKLGWSEKCGCEPGLVEDKDCLCIGTVTGCLLDWRCNSSAENMNAVSVLRAVQTTETDINSTYEPTNISNPNGTTLKSLGDIITKFAAGTLTTTNAINMTTFGITNINTKLMSTTANITTKLPINTSSESITIITSNPSSSNRFVGTTISIITENMTASVDLINSTNTIPDLNILKTTDTYGDSIDGITNDYNAAAISVSKSIVNPMTNLPINTSTKKTDIADETPFDINNTNYEPTNISNPNGTTLKSLGDIITKFSASTFTTTNAINMTTFGITNINTKLMSTTATTKLPINNSSESITIITSNPSSSNRFVETTTSIITENMTASVELINSTNTIPDLNILQTTDTYGDSIDGTTNNYNAAAISVSKSIVNPMTNLAINTSTKNTDIADETPFDINNTNSIRISSISNTIASTSGETTSNNTKILITKTTIEKASNIFPNFITTKQPSEHFENNYSLMASSQRPQSQAFLPVLPPFNIISKQSLSPTETQLSIFPLRQTPKELLKITKNRQTEQQSTLYLTVRPRKKDTLIELLSQPLIPPLSHLNPVPNKLPQQLRKPPFVLSTWNYENFADLSKTSRMPTKLWPWETNCLSCWLALNILSELKRNDVIQRINNPIRSMFNATATKTTTASRNNQIKNVKQNLMYKKIVNSNQLTNNNKLKPTTTNVLKNINSKNTKSIRHPVTGHKQKYLKTKFNLRSKADNPSRIPTLDIKIVTTTKVNKRWKNYLKNNTDLNNTPATNTKPSRQPATRKPTTDDKITVTSKVNEQRWKKTFKNNAGLRKSPATNTKPSRQPATRIIAKTRVKPAKDKPSRKPATEVKIMATTKVNKQRWKKSFKSNTDLNNTLATNTKPSRQPATRKPTTDDKITVTTKVNEQRWKKTFKNNAGLRKSPATNTKPSRQPATRIIAKTRVKPAKDKPSRKSATEVKIMATTKVNKQRWKKSFKSNTDLNNTPATNTKPNRQSVTKKSATEDYITVPTKVNGQRWKKYFKNNTDLRKKPATNTKPSRKPAIGKMTTQIEIVKTTNNAQSNSILNPVNSTKVRKNPATNTKPRKKSTTKSKSSQMSTRNTKYRAKTFKKNKDLSKKPATNTKPSKKSTTSAKIKPTITKTSTKLANKLALRNNTKLFNPPATNTKPSKKPAFRKQTSTSKKSANNFFGKLALKNTGPIKMPATNTKPRKSPGNKNLRTHLTLKSTTKLSKKPATNTKPSKKPAMKNKKTSAAKSLTKTPKKLNLKSITKQNKKVATSVEPPKTRVLHTTKKSTAIIKRRTMHRITKDTTMPSTTTTLSKKLKTSLSKRSTTTENYSPKSEVRSGCQKSDPFCVSVTLNIPLAPLIEDTSLEKHLDSERRMLILPTIRARYFNDRNIVTDSKTSNGKISPENMFKNEEYNNLNKRDILTEPANNPDTDLQQNEDADYDMLRMLIDMNAKLKTENGIPTDDPQTKTAYDVTAALSDMDVENNFLTLNPSSHYTSNQKDNDDELMNLPYINLRKSGNIITNNINSYLNEVPNKLNPEEVSENEISYLPQKEIEEFISKIPHKGYDNNYNATSMHNSLTTKFDTVNLLGDIDTEHSVSTEKQSYYALRPGLTVRNKPDTEIGEYENAIVSEENYPKKSKLALGDSLVPLNTVPAQTNKSVFLRVPRFILPIQKQSNNRDISEVVTISEKSINDYKINSDIEGDNLPTAGILIDTLKQSGLALHKSEKDNFFERRSISDDNRLLLEPEINQQEYYNDYKENQQDYYDVLRKFMGDIKKKRTDSTTDNIENGIYTAKSQDHLTLTNRKNFNNVNIEHAKEDGVRSISLNRVAKVLVPRNKESLFRRVSRFKLATQDEIKDNSSTTKNTFDIIHILDNMEMEHSSDFTDVTLSYADAALNLSKNTTIQSGKDINKEQMNIDMNKYGYNKKIHLDIESENSEKGDDIESINTLINALEPKPKKPIFEDISNIEIDRNNKKNRRVYFISNSVEEDNETKLKKLLEKIDKENIEKENIVDPKSKMLYGYIFDNSIE